MVLVSFNAGAYPKMVTAAVTYAAAARVDLEPLLGPLNKIGRLNRLAADFSAAAALLQVLSKGTEVSLKVGAENSLIWRRV